MKKTILLLFALALISQTVWGQTRETSEPKVSRALKMDVSEQLRDIAPIPPIDKHHWKNGIIKNEDKMPYVRNSGEEEAFKGIDPVWQNRMGTRSVNTIISNFEGVDNQNGVLPPDTQGDVGPNHYFQMINLSFAIYDKQGNRLYGPVDNSTLWSGFTGPWSGTNDGDPVVLYDEQADRWVASQFAIPSSSGPFYELIAVSQTGDPLGAWYRYAFQFDNLPDYPKLGVWSDGYYLTINNFTYDGFGYSYAGAGAAVLERDKMLNGEDAQMVYFDGFGTSDSDPYSFLPADVDGTPPPPGTPNYLAWAADDSWTGVAQDQIEIWTFSVDWTTPSNSALTYLTTLYPEPFDMGLCGSRDCIPQPGTSQGLDAISSRLMFRLQYRNFGTYETLVTNQTVDVDGTDHAGIRWYEFRNTARTSWEIYQQGTYAPDSDNRWMGSAAMDANGNIALGYSVSSSSTYPSIRFTGRTADTPLGQMSFQEEEIIAGSGSQTHYAARWGDYSMMSVDPADGATFWYTTEYVETTGSADWQTRIAGFQLEIDSLRPAQVTDLAATNQTSSSIELQFTSTGDDSLTGTPFFYDVRFSSSPITDDASFDAAEQVANPPAPALPGELVAFSVSGLNYNSNYYFALKVVDEQGNKSPLSNSANGATWDAPQMSVSPASIHYDTDPGDLVVDSIVVSNVASYSSTLDYTVELKNNTFPEDAVQVNLIPVNQKRYTENKSSRSGEMHGGQSINGGGGPDAFGYQWIDSNDPNGPEYVWNDISATGTQATDWTATGSFGALDEGYAGPIALGMNFKFYGDVKNEVYIGTNGTITFAPYSENIFTNDPIPTADVPNDLIAPFWDDLDGTDGGAVYYKQEGNHFIIQYDAWPEYFGSGTYTFQVVLYSSGKIMFYYKSVSGTLNESTTGIENADGSDGLQIAYNSSYVQNNLAVKISAEPEWVLADIPEVTLYNGNSSAVIVTFLTEDIPGGDYSMDFEISGNDPNLPVVTVPVTMTLSGGVPVELTSFTAEASGANVNLKWSTATETNNDGFEVQRKTADKWERAGFVKGNGTTTEKHDYSFTDNVINISADKILYRLKQVDFDGTYDFSSTIEVATVPDKYELSQNYPNPFNPSTTIKFAIPEAGLVNIAVFNVLGEKVADLMNEMKDAGSYELNWDASNLSSGIYIYRMEAGTGGNRFHSVKRMMLLK